MPRGGVAGNSARWTVRFTSAGRPEGLSRDDVLDNVTLYWLTGTVISSARLYWGYDEQPSGGRLLDAPGVQIPGAVRAFPDEIYRAPRSWAEQAYPPSIGPKRSRASSSST